MATPTRRAASTKKRTVPNIDPGSRYPEWSIDLEKFGKIARGTISMAPLVILVGRNNTGKSFAASLIWALMNARQTVFSRRIGPNRRAPAWFKAIIDDSVLNGKTQDYTLSHADCQDALNYVSTVFNSESERILARLFSAPRFKKTSISLYFKNPPAGRIVLKIRPNGQTEKIQANYSISQTKNITTFVITVGAKTGEDFPQPIVAQLFQLVAETVLCGHKHGVSNSVQYIPAARTGLMLAYRPLVSGLLDALGLDDIPMAQGTLPLPTIRFLQALTRRDPSLPDKQFTSIARDLEKNVIDGRVVASRAQVPDFTYLPTNMEDALPLHMASSMVTELAPFLLLLKSGQGVDGLIFEEPEAHLHIQAQRKLARALARLVNAGIPIVITTHSDTFIQQINNLMQLHDHPKKNVLARAMGYHPSEFIDPDLTQAYEFVDGPEGTTINALARVREGFIVPSLNETLAALTTETFAVQDFGR